MAIQAATVGMAKAGALCARWVGAALLGIGVAAVASSGAVAANYTKIDDKDSTITFTYRQMGVTMEGGFGAFQVEAFQFDPDEPQNGEMRITIPLASIDVGYREANDEIGNTEWLDTARFPQASFQSTSLQALGDGRYRADGALTIKGAAEPVRIDFTFDEKPDSGVIDGEFTIERGVFGIGLDEWADTSIVAAEITVQFHLTALP